MPATAILEAFRSYLQALGNGSAAEFISGISWQMRARRLAPIELPCLRHLGRAAAIAPARERALLELLAEGSASRHWGQTYTAADLGERFIDNYGWLELFGTRGHFENDHVAAGFLILGPNLLYPDHHHFAEELYVPLTGGTEWRKGEEGFIQRPAGTVIRHPSNVNHAMRTGREPLVALYVWRGGPLAQKSTITG